MEPKKLLDLIGNTLESVNLIKNKNIKLLLKLRKQSRRKSKDRAAYNMIISALERGDIKKEIN
jgi:cysteine synthase B